MIEAKRRKDCPKCGLEDAPFGKNKTRPDGLSAYCLMCMREGRRNANNSPQDWKAINAKRRSNPEYRAKERKQANLRDKKRRQSDPDYVKKRSASNRKWRTTGDAEGKRKRANALRLEKYHKRQAARTPEEVEAARQRQKEGWDYIRGANKRKRISERAHCVFECDNPNCTAVHTE